MACASICERNLLADISKIVEKNKTCRSAMKKIALITCLAMAAAPDNVNSVLNVIAYMQQQNHHGLLFQYLISVLRPDMSMELLLCKIKCTYMEETIIVIIILVISMF